MVLEFSVMVLLLFFSRVASLFLYNSFLVILKAVVGLDLSLWLAQLGTLNF